MKFGNVVPDDVNKGFFREICFNNKVFIIISLLKRYIKAKIISGEVRTVYSPIASEKRRRSKIAEVLDR